MEAIEKKLNELETAIEDAKEEKSKLQGMLETLTKQMEERFGVSSVKEATKLLKEIKKKLEKQEAELEEKFDELKESYEW